MSLGRKVQKLPLAGNKGTPLDKEGKKNRGTPKSVCLLYHVLLETGWGWHEAVTLLGPLREGVRDCCWHWGPGKGNRCINQENETLAWHWLHTPVSQGKWRDPLWPPCMLQRLSSDVRLSPGPASPLSFLPQPGPGKTKAPTHLQPHPHLQLEHSHWAEALGTYQIWRHMSVTSQTSGDTNSRRLMVMGTGGWKFGVL